MDRCQSPCWDASALARVVLAPAVRRRSRTVLVTSLLLCLLSGMPASAATQATPAPSDIPEPAACTVEARPPASLAAVSGTPSATLGEPGPVSPLRPPMAMPEGDSVDDETLAGITTTIRELVACHNAGEGDRQSGLYSDDYFRRAAMGRASLPGIAGIAAPSAETPAAERPRQAPAAMPLIADARRLLDGRIGAIVDPGAMEIPADIFFIFVQQGERWLVDEIVLVERDGS